MLPALSMHYGLKPWDLERMTRREISEYIVQLEQAQASQEA